MGLVELVFIQVCACLLYIHENYINETMHDRIGGDSNSGTVYNR